MNTGLILNESFADYIASPAVGSGRLEDLRPRPLVYFKRWVERTMAPRKATAALDFGRLFHCLAMEGETLMATRYVSVPAGAPDDLRRFRNAKTKAPATVASIEWWDKFEADAAGREVVTQADIDLAWKMVGAIRSNPAALEILARGKPEVTFRHQLPAFAVQARVDWFDGDDPAGPLLVNVKTIESLDDFDEQFHRFAYYKGDAFYRLVVAKVLGVEPFVPQCIDLVVEKTEPYECEIRVPDAEAIAIGASEVMGDLMLLARCYESGEWPGASRARRPVSLPEWKVRRGK